MPKKTQTVKKNTAGEDRFAELTLLHRSAGNSYPHTPERAKLEVFKNLYSDRNYLIVFDCPEFTSLCPVTNQPDFGKITIRYVPDKLCVESKSLKIHLFSYRGHNTFHEEAVNSIHDAVAKACKPRELEVVGVFNPRGGVAISVRAGRITMF
jgi:7-cyano-7-deazaguanine reductase